MKRLSAEMFFANIKWDSCDGIFVLSVKCDRSIDIVLKRSPLMMLIKQHKTTSVFVCLFIIAGICNLLSHTQNTFFNSIMFCANFMILVGLVLFWGQTVRKRILPTKTRSFMIASSMFMTVYIIMRVFKYRVVINNADIERYFVYGYFVPLLMLPSLFLVTSICLSFRNIKSMSFI